MKVYRVKRQLDGSVNEKLGLSKRFETVPDSGSGGACIFQQPLWHHSREAMLISLIKANICRQLRISPSDVAAVQAEVEQLATGCGDDSPVPCCNQGSHANREAPAQGSMLRISANFGQLENLHLDSHSKISLSLST